MAQSRPLLPFGVTEMDSIVRDAFHSRGITHVGVCDFEATLPLLDVRAKDRLPGGARSVIVCALPYFSGEYPERNVARYAVCDDYHTAGGALLEAICGELRGRLPGYAFVGFIDDSPIREVAAARLAGLGVVGLHGQLILPEFGGYLFIGCVVTDLALESSQPEAGVCLECEACLRACPTRALTREGLVRERCRSHITQKRGKLTSWEEEQIRAGKMVWGCDICLDACPMNKGAKITPLTELRRNPLPVLSEEALDYALERKAYGYRGKAVIERNLALILRCDK